MSESQREVAVKTAKDMAEEVRTVKEETYNFIIRIRKKMSDYMLIPGLSTTELRRILVDAGGQELQSFALAGPHTLSVTVEEYV